MFSHGTRMQATEPLGRSFRFLLGATGLSNLADGILVVGAPLLAVTTTRSPILVSLVSAAAAAPWLLITLLAGALADRRDRRRIMVIASWSRAVVLTAAAVAAAAALLPLPVLLITVLLVGVGEVFSDTSAQSALPMTVPPPLLTVANGRITSAQTVTNGFLGGPIAGVLVAVAGAAVLAVPALLYAAAGLLLLGMHGRYQVEVHTRQNLRADIAVGLRYLRAHRVLRSLAAFAGTLNFANGAYFAVLVLWVVGDSSQVGLTPAGYGLLTAALAAGAVLGALLVHRAARKVGETNAMLLAVLTSSLPLLIPVVAPTPTAIVPALVVIGAGGAASNVLIVSLRQRLIPEPLFGRVNATYRLIAAGTTPLGAVAGGLLTDWAGFPAVGYTAAGLCVIAVILVARPVSGTTAEVEHIRP